jgi:transcriptional regulator with PAS, ATPase and Fis domain
MQTVVDKMAAACGNRATVLITGESGTGKEMVARGIHYNTFKDDAPFVAVNCGALPKDLIESELFGYKRGAFTGAIGDSEGLFRAADGGTIFLDEIMEMSPELQVKLMRVLQERKIRHLGDTREIPINVRVIAATNKPIQESLESGSIRKDLYYRLSVITIHLPPLRDRSEDIPLLIEHFLKKHQADYNSPVTSIEPSALEVLSKYPWPGNVRELENLVEMLLAYAKSPVIRVSDLPERITEGASVPKKAAIGDDDVFTLKEAERKLIVNALSKSKGNKSHAAQMLGISRKSLYKKLVDYNIQE